MTEHQDARRPVAVIAFGGNALLRPQDHGTQEEQFTLTWKATRWLVEIIHRGFELVIVHGNGPQVGNIMIQVEEAITKIPPQSLEVCVAQTEGSMGFMLQNQLRNRLNEEQLAKPVVTVLTEVEVARDDPAFENPSKPVGPYFTAYRANLLMQEQGWQMVEDAGRGWRKVVPSPRPKRILDVGVIRRLVEGGAVVVAAGGGGIPVYQDVGNYFNGVEAVIDKDYTTSLLAQELDADLFIVLTQVAQVAENFGRPNQRWLQEITVAKAKEMLEQHQFPPGSMGPKIRAAIEFVEKTGKEVLITDAEHLKDALARTSGTYIVADRAGKEA
ncbi:MAG: carbamate kinase [Acidobacteria bacterium 21-70-11]|nr:MAG: carbamate kinase [Acidobacteria bacterium 21-70-11]HQT96010.1 carbamate kinase [Thermoanaerobaculaceae bacterium]HQU34892.1 carbamate kinase [Thermoanaerobaculaceae bacterium]